MGSAPPNTEASPPLQINTMCGGGCVAVVRWRCLGQGNVRREMFGWVANVRVPIIRERRAARMRAVGGREQVVGVSSILQRGPPWVWDVIEVHYADYRALKLSPMEPIDLGDEDHDEVVCFISIRRDKNTTSQDTNASGKCTRMREMNGKRAKLVLWQQYSAALCCPSKIKTVRFQNCIWQRLRIFASSTQFSYRGKLSQPKSHLRMSP